MSNNTLDCLKKETKLQHSHTQNIIIIEQNKAIKHTVAQPTPSDLKVLESVETQKRLYCVNSSEETKPQCNVENSSETHTYIATPNIGDPRFPITTDTVTGNWKIRHNIKVHVIHI